MAVSAIAFVMYPVTDMARALEFYGGTLGLVENGIKMDYWVEYDLAGATFGIGTFEQVGKPGTAQSLSLEIDDLPAFRARLERHGVATTEPFETPVCWISGLTDPDGNRIWLHQAKKA